jgi:hypothetical protein
MQGFLWLGGLSLGSAPVSLFFSVSRGRHKPRFMDDKILGSDKLLLSDEELGVMRGKREFRKRKW